MNNLLADVFNRLLATVHLFRTAYKWTFELLKIVFFLSYFSRDVNQLSILIVCVFYGHRKG